MQFTDKDIKNLKPESKRYDVREKSGNGFSIRVSPSGEKSWIYFYSFHGRKRRMTLGSYPALSLANARKKHREAIQILEMGNDPSLEKQKNAIEARDSLTIKSLITEYLEIWAKPRKRSWQEDQRILNKDVYPTWGKYKAKDISRRDVHQLLDKIKDRGAPIIANRTFSCIRRMFNFAIERDIIQINPCSRIKPPSQENRRNRFLVADEIKIFWDRLLTSPMSQSIRLALQFQLVTAQRKGEVISAKWSDIDFNNMIWTIPAENSKNKHEHRVPITQLAHDLLIKIKSNSDSSIWLFPGERTDNHIRSQSVDRALRRYHMIFEDLEPFCPHDLRRSAITHMASLRVSGEVLSRIANHAKRGVTEQHYIKHSYDDEKRHALEVWANKLKEIITDNTVSFIAAI